MATILQFRRPEGSEPRVDKTLDRPLGDIVIFPGVRIERWAQRSPPKANARPQRRRAQRARKK